MRRDRNYQSSVVDKSLWLAILIDLNPVANRFDWRVFDLSKLEYPNTEIQVLNQLPGKWGRENFGHVQVTRLKCLNQWSSPWKTRTREFRPCLSHSTKVNQSVIESLAWIMSIFENPKTDLTAERFKLNYAHNSLPNCRRRPTGPPSRRGNCITKSSSESSSEVPAPITTCTNSKKCVIPFPNRFMCSFLVLICVLNFSKH